MHNFQDTVIRKSCNNWNILKVTHVVYFFRHHHTSTLLSFRLLHYHFCKMRLSLITSHIHLLHLSANVATFCWHYFPSHIPCITFYEMQFLCISHSSTLGRVVWKIQLKYLSRSKNSGNYFYSSKIRSTVCKFYFNKSKKLWIFDRTFIVKSKSSCLSQRTICNKSLTSRLMTYNSKFFLLALNNTVHFPMCFKSLSW